MSAKQICRLCGGDTAALFQLPVLGDLSVQYLRCADCGSVQTEEPTWLDRAYSSALAELDTWNLHRNTQNRALVYLALRILGEGRARVLDYGGGYGILCRLLRDWRIDCAYFDAYASSGVAGAYRYDAPDERAFDVVTAFEVLEHLPDPAEGLVRMFAGSPRHLLASTRLVRGEISADWAYLAPETGQHIFFYAARAMEMIARRHGYTYTDLGAFHLFSKAPISAAQRALLRLCTKGAVKLFAAPFIEAAIMVTGDYGALADQRQLLQRARAGVRHERAKAPRRMPPEAA